MVMKIPWQLGARSISCEVGTLVSSCNFGKHCSNKLSSLSLTWTTDISNTKQSTSNSLHQSTTGIAKMNSNKQTLCKMMIRTVKLSVSVHNAEPMMVRCVFILPFERQNESTSHNIDKTTKGESLLNQIGLTPLPC